jgi:hypothetical protein
MGLLGNGAAGFLRGVHYRGNPDMARAVWGREMLLLGAGKR